MNGAAWIVPNLSLGNAEPVECEILNWSRHGDNKSADMATVRCANGRTLDVPHNCLIQTAEMPVKVTVTDDYGEYTKWV